MHDKHETKIEVLIDEPLMLHLTELNEHKDLIGTVIKKGGLRASDTGFSYRQINYLSTKGLLNPEQEEKGWRSFSFKDLVYLSILSELKLFSLPNKFAENVHDLFYAQNGSEAIDRAILACLIGIEMTFIYSPSGEGLILCPDYLELYEAGTLIEGYDNRSIELRMTINIAVNKTLEGFGSEPIKTVDSLKNRLIEYMAMPQAVIGEVRQRKTN